MVGGGSRIPCSICRIWCLSWNKIYCILLCFGSFVVVAVILAMPVVSRATSSDFAIARVMQEQEDSLKAMKLARQHDSERGLMTKATMWWDGDGNACGDGVVGRADEWWDETEQMDASSPVRQNGRECEADAKGIYRVGEKGSAVTTAVRDICTRSKEIARRVSEAGVKGMVALKPRIRLTPTTLLQHHREASHDIESSYNTDARTRLCQLLRVYSLSEIIMQGDGNCQYRALAQQIYGKSSEHEAVRERVVQQLARDPLRYRDFVDYEDYTAYVSCVSSPGSWGDHITLQVRSASF